MSQQTAVPQIELGENERLDDLQYEGLYVIQRKDKYCFTSDAVALANLAEVKRGEVVAELGGGCGVISILLYAKKYPKHVHCIEYQGYLADLSTRNVALNGLSDVITVHNMRMQEAPQKLGAASCDVVITNPPYSKYNPSMMNEDEEVAICRHEIAVTLDEVIASAESLLRFGGRLYVIYKAERLTELVCACTAKNMAVKRILLLNVTHGNQIDTVIVEAKKGGKAGVKLLLV